MYDSHYVYQLIYIDRMVIHQEKRSTYKIFSSEDKANEMRYVMNSHNTGESEYVVLKTKVN